MSDPMKNEPEVETLAKLKAQCDYLAGVFGGVLTPEHLESLAIGDVTVRIPTEEGLQMFEQISKKAGIPATVTSDLASGVRLLKKTALKMKFEKEISGMCARGEVAIVAGQLRFKDTDCMKAFAAALEMDPDLPAEFLATTASIQKQPNAWVEPDRVDQN